MVFFVIFVPLWFHSFPIARLRCQALAKCLAPATQKVFFAPLRLGGSILYPPSSFNTSRAAFTPGIPVSPPPGCVPAPHRYSPATGVA